MNPTLYDILGVAPDASREEIRNAWRDAADRFEPGEGGSTKQFRLFNEAAEVLLDPERRKAYDAQLSGGKDSDRDKAEGKTEGQSDKPQGRTGVRLDKTPDKPEKKDKKTTPSPASVPMPPVPGAARATTSADPEPTAVTPSRDEPVDTGEDTVEVRGRAVPWPVLAVLGVVTAVAIGFAAYFVTQAQRAEAYQEALDRAPAAAESAATAVLSYDYESLDADRDAAAKFLSDDYRSDYVDTFDKLVKDSATETKAKVEAQVLASSAMVGGEDRDPDRVPVLIFVNQSTTSTASSEPSVALNRVRFDMVQVDGTWLVDGITSY